MIQAIADFLTYLFDFSPTRDFPLQTVIILLIAISLLLSFGLIWQLRKTQDKSLKKILREYPGKFITLAVLLGINLFSRLYRIDVLSMRLITFALSLWIVYTAYRLYKDIFVKYPEQLKNQPLTQEIERKYHIVKNKSKKHRQR